jgi:hypothetical protein
MERDRNKLSALISKVGERESHNETLLTIMLIVNIAENNQMMTDSLLERQG